jgi:uncharacterized membrane protein (DUF485 family)
MQGAERDTGGGMKLLIQAAIFATPFTLPLLALIYFVFPELRAYFEWLAAGSIIVGVTVLVGAGVVMERQHGIQTPP